MKAPHSLSGEVDVSVLVVTYNNAADVANLLTDLQALKLRSSATVEFLLHDNASQDDTVDRIRSAGWEVFSSAENAGFGKAVNGLAGAAKGRLLFMLNPDCRLESEVLDTCVAYLKTHRDVGALSPAVSNPGMRALSGGYAPGLRTALMYAFFVSRAFPSRPWAKGIFAYAKSSETEVELEWIGGTALLVRAEVFRALHGFDERWFMYGEDVDLGCRLNQLGYRQVMLMESRVSHRLGGSNAKPVSARTEWIGHIIEVHSKHRPGRARNLIFCCILQVGFLLRRIASRSRDDRGFYAAAARECKRRAW